MQLYNIARSICNINLLKLIGGQNTMRTKITLLALMGLSIFQLTTYAEHMEPSNKKPDISLVISLDGLETTLSPAGIGSKTHTEVQELKYQINIEDSPVYSSIYKSGVIKGYMSDDYLYLLGEDENLKKLPIFTSVEDITNKDYRSSSDSSSVEFEIRNPFRSNYDFFRDYDLHQSKTVVRVGSAGNLFNELVLMRDKDYTNIIIENVPIKRYEDYHNLMLGIPVRLAFESAGYKVNYDASKNIVEVTNND